MPITCFVFVNYYTHGSILRKPNFAHPFYSLSKKLTVTPKQHTKHVHLRNNKFHSEQAETVWNYQFLALRKGAFIVNMGVTKVLKQ
jgi:hypothetical protein